MYNDTEYISKKELKAYLNPHILEQVKQSEGYSPNVYKDPVGISTIGYGFTKPALDALDPSIWKRVSKHGMSKKEADQILLGMFTEYVNNFNTIPNFNKLKEHQKQTIYSLGHIRPNLHRGGSIYKAIAQERPEDVPKYMTWGIYNPTISKGIRDRWNRFIHTYNTGIFTNSNKGVPDYLEMLGYSKDLNKSQVKELENKNNVEGALKFYKSSMSRIADYIKSQGENTIAKILGNYNKSEYKTEEYNPFNLSTNQFSTYIEEAANTINSNKDLVNNILFNSPKETNNKNGFDIFDTPAIRSLFPSKIN